MRKRTQRDVDIVLTKPKNLYPGVRVTMDAYGTELQSHGTSVQEALISLVTNLVDPVGDLEPRDVSRQVTSLLIDLLKEFAGGSGWCTQTWQALEETLAERAKAPPPSLQAWAKAASAKIDADRAAPYAKWELAEIEQLLAAHGADE